MQAGIIFPWGVLRFSSDWDNRRFFFSITEFFLVGNFGNFFLGWLDLSRDFFSIQNKLKIQW